MFCRNIHACSSFQLSLHLFLTPESFCWLFFIFELFKFVADPPSLNLGDSMAEVELHSSALAALCRVCGKRLDNQRVSYFCSSHAVGLTRAFGVTTAGDSHEIHPQKFCNGCYRALMQYIKVEEEGRDYNSAISVEWRKHTDHECQTCQLYTRSKVGGRPPKGRKNHGRPRNVELEKATVSRSELKQQAKAVAGPSFNSQAALHPARFIHHIGLQDLICGLCNVVNEPVETMEYHLFQKLR